MSSKILFSDNYEVVPVDIIPDKSDWYHVMNINKEIIYNQRWFSTLHNCWDGKDFEFWLRPKASSVVLSMDEIKVMIGDAFDSGKDYGVAIVLYRYEELTNSQLKIVPDKDKYTENLLNPQP